MFFGGGGIVKKKKKNVVSSVGDTLYLIFSIINCSCQMIDATCEWKPSFINLKHKVKDMLCYMT